MKSDPSKTNFNEFLRVRRLLEKMYETMLDHTEISRTQHEFLKSSSLLDSHNNPLKTMADNHKLLDSDDLIKLLKISKSTYYRLKNDQVIKPIRIRGRDYYSMDDINRLLRRKE